MPRALLLCLLLAACDVPSPEMRGATKQVVTIDGSRFSVYVLGDRAEAIRTNPEYRDGIMERGYRAIRAASGCAIRPGSFAGDPARMTARLTCA